MTGLFRRAGARSPRSNRASGTARTARTGDAGAYAPRPDGQPDPGEVVWGWVPYEEDARRGKDRPVLLVGRRGDRWLALMLTSKDHDRDAADEARHGRRWMDVGTGAWDRERRPSEVRLDRLIELAPDAIRREGAALPRPTYDAVVAAARGLHTFG
nr:type II toxin-antitoxin system PemK/MazF family toxin [Nocardioides luti]